MVLTNDADLRYEIVTYRGSEAGIETHTRSHHEALAIDLAPFHHLIWMARGIYAFHEGAGNWTERSLDGSGLGPVCLDILEVVQLSPGVFVEPQDIAYLTGNENLNDAGTLAARVLAIRKAHRPARHEFVRTRRTGGYALMWPENLAWIRIDRIPVRSE